MESPFASWMERLRFEDPSRAIPDEKSDDAELIAKTGDKHEDRFLQSLRDQGRDIASVPKDDFKMELGLIRQAITGIGDDQKYLCNGPIELFQVVAATANELLILHFNGRN